LPIAQVKAVLSYEANHQDAPRPVRWRHSLSTQETPDRNTEPSAISIFPAVDRLRAPRFSGGHTLP
jgi:hypothetical protein